MSTHLLRSLLVVASLLGVLTVNGLANSLPLNGQTTGDVARMFDTRFAPAGYVFSIWGPIYLALIAFVAYQLRRSVGARPWAARVGALFALSCAANAAWMFAWHFERFVLSEVLMLTLLGSLLAMYLSLDIGRSGRRGADRWLVEAPIQLYLGWITVATVANTTTLLTHLGWGGWGLSGELWAAALLVVCVGLAAAMTVTRRDAIFDGVIAWAAAGIAVAQADAPLVRGVAWAACVCAVALGLAAALGPRAAIRAAAD